MTSLGCSISYRLPSSLEFPTFLALSYLLFSLYFCICTLKISLLSFVWLEDINFCSVHYLNWKKLFSMQSAKFFLSYRKRTWILLICLEIQLTFNENIHGFAFKLISSVGLQCLQVQRKHILWTMNVNVWTWKLSHTFYIHYLNSLIKQERQN